MPYSYKMYQMRQEDAKQYFCNFPLPFFKGISVPRILSCMHFFDLICNCSAGPAFHVRSSIFGANPERLHKSKRRWEGKDAETPQSKDCSQTVSLQECLNWAHANTQSASQDSSVSTYQSLLSQVII